MGKVFFSKSLKLAFVICLFFLLGESSRAEPFNVELTSTNEGIVGQVNFRHPFIAGELIRELEAPLKLIWEQAQKEERSFEFFFLNARSLFFDLISQKVSTLLIANEAANKISKKQLKAVEKFLEKNPGLDRATVLKEFYLKNEFADKTAEIDPLQISRYYQKNIDQFTSKAIRRLRLIQVTTPAEAEIVEREISKGVDFAHLATQSSNQFRADEGGVLNLYEVDQPFVIQELNEALGAVEVGEISQKLSVPGGGFWWLFFEKEEKSEVVPISKVYRSLESFLKTKNYQKKVKALVDRLYEEGNFTPIEEMAHEAAQIALNRLANGMANREVKD